MKKILVLGSNREIEKIGKHPKGCKAQHIPEDYFGKNIEKVYVDLFRGDIKHDLNKIPYPFKKNEFDGIFASHILEHLNPLILIKIIEELHRISKDKSNVIIYVPHISNSASLTHLTHFRAFNSGTFNLICDNVKGWEKYTVGKFDLLEKKINIPRRFFFCNFISEDAYEAYFSRFFPAHDIKFVLRVKK